MTQRFFILSLAILAAAGCVAPASGPGHVDKEAWNPENAPERFDADLEYRLDALPREGRADHEAWPSFYWAHYLDGINARWLEPSELSPAEKYDMAFNDWSPSEDFETLRPFHRDAPVPNEDWDPRYYDELGPLAFFISQEFGNREDREQALSLGGSPGEWPVETWWGLCHLWTPAAMLEARPQNAVTYNGVRFEVGDIEALLIAAYEGSDYQFLGGRCDEREVERDELGRAVNTECRDTNPGSFHVIMANYLGLRGESVAEDRTYDAEVWNQPVVAFDVSRMEEIDVTKANELLGADGVEYEYNAGAAQLFEVHASATYITESHPSTTPARSSEHERTDYYTYILEVDSDGLIIGGEWFGESRHDQPDFLWKPVRPERTTMPFLDLDQVRMLVQLSRGDAVEETGPGAPIDDETTPSDPGARRFVGEGMMAIPDDAPAIYSFAHVPEGTAGGFVSVELDITHPYAGDLLVTLHSPAGDRWVLYDRENGVDLHMTMDLGSIPTDAMAGNWQLSVADQAAFDVGSLDSWALVVE